jgi:hypothetical protein
MVKIIDQLANACLDFKEIHLNVVKESNVIPTTIANMITHAKIRDVFTYVVNQTCVHLMPFVQPKIIQLNVVVLTTYQMEIRTHIAIKIQFNKFLNVHLMATVLVKWHVLMRAVQTRALN